MTDRELADLFCGGAFPITVSMSAAGVFLTIGDSQHEITEHQAEIIWNAMLFPPRRPAVTSQVRREGQP